MTTDKITALLERVEKATEGSRVLDFELHIQLVEDAVWPVRDPAGRMINPDSRMSDYLALHRDVIDSDDQDFDFPRYTTSIDAALALVERELPGWGWAFANSHKDFLCEGEPPIAVDLIGPPQWSEEDEFGHQQYWCDSASAAGFTLPLAIIAALLKALKDQSGGRG